MNIRIFDSLIEQMNRDGLDYTIPRAFQGYCDEIGLVRKRDSTRTAPCISIDFQENLKAELREKNVMVFRLGIPYKQKNTFFGLARVKYSWSDYFIFDESDSTTIEFHLNARKRDRLTAFRVLPRITEKSIVNFIIASGVLQETLSLDDVEENLVPANCQSTFSFNFKPHSEIKVSWEHSRGQVEIDSLFFAKQAGTKRLFLIESKHNTTYRTLAKHKLVYPVLALRDQLKKVGIPITPIYLKTATYQNDLIVNLTICDFTSSHGAISDLNPILRQHLIIKNFLDNH